MDDPVPTREPGRLAREWSVLERCLAESSPIALAACAVGSTAAVSAATAGWIPLASGIAVTLLVPAALVDSRVGRLPDVWIVAAALIIALEVMAQPLIPGGSGVPATIAGALAMAGPLLALHLVTPASMGFGDVKAAAVLGAAAGVADWQLAVVALALASGTTATVGVLRRTDRTPLGPGLVGGTIVALVARELFLRGSAT